jgi:hypothetical protein
MPAKAIGSGESAWSRVQRQLKSEWRDPEKRRANIKIARAFAVFAGSVLAIRSFGEALFV